MSAAARLTDAQIARFRSDGYITLEQICSPREVARLREIFDRLFSERAGWERGRQWDLAGTDEEGAPPKLPQISNPAEFAPELLESEYRKTALEIARQLLGPDAEPWFEHAILKPAGYGAPTPWHQDEAHRDDPGTQYEQVSIWMPLQEATVENGCMEFVPGSHQGPVLEHRSPNGDPRITALECIGAFDSSKAVPCPLPSGGATIHHCRTLHHAGANSSSIPRRAYILAFRGPTRADLAFHGYPWNISKQTAAQARAAAWAKRGGILAKVGRSATKFASRAVVQLKRAASFTLLGS